MLLPFSPLISHTHTDDHVDRMFEEISNHRIKHNFIPINVKNR